MPTDQIFPEYAIAYSVKAKSVRNKLSPLLRSALDLIVDDLSDNPNKYPTRIDKLEKNVFMYQHPKPQILVTYKLHSGTKRIEIIHIAALMLEVRKLLFISYSHQDKEYLDDLKKCLKPLEQRDMIKIWDDNEIKAGEEWRKEIEKALSTAKAALLLISPEFLKSDFITRNELLPLLEKAEDEGLNILWIAIKRSKVEKTKIAKYQAVHKEPPLSLLEPNAKKKEFKQIYDKIKKAVGQ